VKQAVFRCPPFKGEPPAEEAKTRSCREERSELALRQHAALLVEEPNDVVVAELTPNLRKIV
jgi:hypothetical protein